MIQRGVTMRREAGDVGYQLDGEAARQQPDDVRRPLVSGGGGDVSVQKVDRLQPVALM
jgi:hypothetical protein